MEINRSVTNLAQRAATQLMESEAELRTLRSLSGQTSTYIEVPRVQHPTMPMNLMD